MYKDKSIQLAIQNTSFNHEGKAVIAKDDEWRDETEWDVMFEQIKKETQVRGN